MKHNLIKLICNQIIIFFLFIIPLIGAEYNTGYMDGIFYDLRPPKDVLYFMGPSTREIPGSSNLKIVVSLTYNNTMCVKFIDKTNKILWSNESAIQANTLIVYTNGDYWALLEFITDNITDDYTRYAVNLIYPINRKTCLGVSTGINGAGRIIEVHKSPDNKLCWFYWVDSFSQAHHSIFDFSIDRIVGGYTWPTSLLFAGIINHNEGVPAFQLYDGNGAKIVYGTYLPWLKIIQPNGGETLIGGKQYQIKWEKKGWPQDSKIIISSSQNSGKYWDDETESISNSGKFNWKIPEYYTEKGRIRVAFDKSPNYVYAISEKDFTIKRSDYVDSEELPIKNFVLIQNYPNPFNNSTTIKFNLSKLEQVNLQIFDIQGKLINTLIDNLELSGENSIIWYGNNFSGEIVSSGVYFYQIQTNFHKINRKMIFIR